MKLFGNFIPEDLEEKITHSEEEITKEEIGDIKKKDIKEAERVLTTDKKDLPNEDIEEKTVGALKTEKSLTTRDMPTFKEMKYWEEIRREGGWEAVREQGGYEIIIKIWGWRAVKELGGWEAVGEEWERLDKEEKGEASLKQSVDFSTMDVITGPLLDGFMFQGVINLIEKTPSPLKIDPITKRVLEEDRTTEIVIIDRKRDLVLEEMYNWAESIRDLPIEEKSFLIAQKVYNIMGGNKPGIVDSVEKKLAKSKEDILIGEINEGVCRQRAFLFHFLATEARINSCIRRGFMVGKAGYGGHDWNEIIDENGEIRVVDIMNPTATTGDFSTLSFEEYQKEGGVPKPSTSRLGMVYYLNSSEEIIYSGAQTKFTEEALKNMKEYFINQGCSEKEAEKRVQDEIADLDKNEARREELLKIMEAQLRTEYEQKRQEYFERLKNK